MKKEVHLMLEYECLPLWIYDEHGEFIDNALLDEIQEDKSLLEELDEIQCIFESLYINTQQEFRYVGFISEEEKQNFELKISKVYEDLCNLLGDNYIIKNMVEIPKVQ